MRHELLKKFKSDFDFPAPQLGPDGSLPTLNQNNINVSHNPSSLAAATNITALINKNGFISNPGGVGLTVGQKMALAASASSGNLGALPQLSKAQLAASDSKNQAAEVLMQMQKQQLYNQRIALAGAHNAALFGWGGMISS